MANSRICSIPDCGKPLKARGWCNAHHRRWMRYGDPNAGTTQQGAPLKFIDRVLSSPAVEGCIDWPFATLPTGYGHLWVDGVDIVASRYVCQRVHGDAPTPEHDAAHSCGRGKMGCINPTHVSWKTRSENEGDKIAHGTNNRGERNGKSKLTAESVKEIMALKGQITGREAGKLFGTTRWTVYKIWSGHLWSWLNPQDLGTPQ